MTLYHFIRQIKHAWQVYVVLNGKYGGMDYLSKQNINRWVGSDGLYSQETIYSKENKRKIAWNT